MHRQHRGDFRIQRMQIYCSVNPDAERLDEPTILTVCLRLSAGLEYHNELDDHIFEG